MNHQSSHRFRGKHAWVIQQTISIAENTNFAFDINASDPDGDNLIYEKTGGVIKIYLHSI